MWGDPVPVVTAEPPRRRRTVLVSLLVALSTAVLGVGVGLLWRVLAPHLTVRKLEQGFAYIEAQPEQPVAADGWFAFLGLAAGVLAALVAWFALRHRRGALVMAGLVLGSLVGGWLGWWLGVRLEVAAFETLVASTPVGGLLDAPLSLRITDLDRMQLWPPKATGVVVAQALAAAFLYTSLAGFAADPDLRAVRPDRDAELPAAPPPAWPLPEAGPIGSGYPDFGTARPDFGTVRPDFGTVRPDQTETVWPPAAGPGVSSGPAGPSDPKGPPALP